MGLQVVEHELTTTGSPAAVYALLIDGSTWPEWSPIDSFELVSPGAGTPEGVGAVRIFPPAGSGVGSAWWWRSRMSSSATCWSQAWPSGTIERW